MPAGLPYFAWIDASETTFGPEHLRWDEHVFSFTLSQEEGDPASLTLAVLKPRNVSGNPIGLLGPGRKIWAWFALDCDGANLIKFRGRLVGIPTSISEEQVTLEFVAKPIDLVAQKAALADSLRVLPFYDEAVIEPSRRDDPDLVLEGYTKIWHYDPQTHVMTVSDEVVGEDGTVIFDGTSDTGKTLYDGLGLTLTSGPLARVDINAEYTWTQQATGTVDLTGYLRSHWPGRFSGAFRSLNASDWPKHGTSLGDGWDVAESTASDLQDFTVQTENRSGSLTSIMVNGSTATVQWSTSEGTVSATDIEQLGFEVTNNSYSVQHDVDQDGQLNASSSRNWSTVSHMLGVQSIKATLVAGYKAERQMTENVSLTLLADVQPILTDPEDGEALRIDDIKSVNLTSGEDLAPIIDPRRRSYIATERGNQSVEHLIALARAHLMKRARVVEIAFAPKLARMYEITLRKNAYLADPRVGEALGKIIAYSIELDGSDGGIKCEVRIGCTIGRGGSAVATAGGPTYAEIDYVGPDYQSFIGRTVLLDTSVGYQPPSAAPNDDGIDFLSTLRAEDVIEVGLTVEHGPEDAPTGVFGGLKDHETAVPPQFETRAKFKLKSMKKTFATDYEIQVTDLKIPTGYDLEAT